MNKYDLARGKGVPHAVRMAKPYADAVADFDVTAFVEHAVEAGARHVLFTTTHSGHYLPGPNPEVDRILPGRTCDGDLLMEVADGLERVRIRLIVYYNSCLHPHDAEWREAVHADDKSSTRFFDHWCRIIAWTGEHYGRKIAAFWFDGGYELTAFDNAPWEAMTAAAKAGNPSRLICYNPGIELHTLYTPLQYFWAGEVCRLN